MTTDDFPLVPEPLRDRAPGEDDEGRAPGPYDDPDLSDQVAFPMVENTFTSMPSLVVNVDFNDLLESKGQEKALEIVGILKDLLGPSSDLPSSSILARTQPRSHPS